jgi:hypothetical protein
MVVILGLMVVGLLRRVAPLMDRCQAMLDIAILHVRHSGLPAGSLVPAFMADDVHGGIFTDVDLHGSRSVILFLSSTCSSCDRLFGDLRAGRAPELDAQLVVVTADASDATALAAGTPSARVLVQRSDAVSRAFASDRTPHAFVVDGDAIIRASAMPTSWEEILAFLGPLEGGGGPVESLTAATAQ